MIALGIEDNRLTAIRQPKGETLVIEFARKSTNRVQVNYICTFLISKFTPISHKASSNLCFLVF